MNNTFLKKTKRFWKYVVIFYLSIILLFIGLNIGLFGKMPSLEELKNPKNNMASEILASDGTLIGKIYTHNRVPCQFDELPPHLVNALIATEDSRFYIHSGIDPKALMGVVKGLFIEGNRGGGSTISQQLAKNLFPRGKTNKISLVFKKFKEWLIAIKLERNFTKHEIIANYFNTVEFSDNAFGIKSATRTYFNKDLKDLSVSESAVLVGMLKAPYKYNPRLHPEASRQRRNTVLSKMLQYNFITTQQYDSFSKEEIKVNFNNDFNVEGVAPYFVAYVQKYLKDYFKVHPKKDGSYYDIYSDGLKIHTTINLQMQQYAEEAAKEHLTSYQELMFSHWAGGDPWKGRTNRFFKHIKETERYRVLIASGKSEEEAIAEIKKPVKMRIFSHRKGEFDTLMSPWDSVRYYKMFLQTGFLAMDPRNGYVKAWVGGANFKYFKFDHVNIGTKRQVGSVFKPFLYAVAVEQKGYSPCHQMPNARIVFRPGNPRWKLGAAWSPSNSGGGYGGMPTLKQALSKSLNTVSARLIYEVGPTAVIDLLRNLGIDTNTKIPPYPSICLGTPEISVYEMIGAYTAFANEGLYTKPTFITKIEDNNGNLVFEHYPSYRQVLSPQCAYIMQEMMKGVVDGGGTAGRLRWTYGLEGTICGKTGTTQSNADGWFIGLTPDLIAGAWVGCDDRLVRFRSTGLGQGASMALPIWGKFFQKITKNPKVGISLEKDFVKPAPELISIETDCAKYKGWGVSTYDEDKSTYVNTRETEDFETKYDDYEESYEGEVEESSAKKPAQKNKDEKPSEASIINNSADKPKDKAKDKSKEIKK
jgi:penicillin-binding protein 1A